MKLLASEYINPFGGLNFVLEEFDRLNIGETLLKELPSLATQSRYSWKDILYSLWSIYFCGGDCIEDLGKNLRSCFSSHPYFNIPSPDRVLARLKELASPVLCFKTPRGKATHELNPHKVLNRLNLKMFKKTTCFQGKKVTCDYDNTLIFNKKADAKNTYKKQYGYAPGVAIIDKKIVYVENRNGNSAAQILQSETLERMFKLFQEEGIYVDIFRGDGASYQLDTLQTIAQNVDKFYIRARMSQQLSNAIATVDHWQEVDIENEKAYRGSTHFVPFTSATKRKKVADAGCYRLIVTKVARKDKQVDLFSGEAYHYYCIITNDEDKTEDEVVFFYNQRGGCEKEFDVLKNDFGWNHLPFSKLAQNTVFLIFTAMCKNLYEHIITLFSQKYEGLAPTFRMKKFIFRFITIPAKWVKTSRVWKLRIYGKINFKT